MNRLLLLALGALLAATQAPEAEASVMTYTIRGTGSGVVGSTSFSHRAYTIALVGDTSLWDGMTIDPLQSATLSVAGLGTATLLLDTRLGFNAQFNTVFFSRHGPFGFDLFDIQLDPPGVDLTQSFGAVLGTEVFTLENHQFDNVASSLGNVTLSESSGVVLQGLGSTSPAPEPASLPLMLGGAALLRGALRRRKLSA